MKHYRSTLTICTAFMAAFIGVIYFYISFYIPFTGDDLGYRENFIASVDSPESLIYYYKLHWYWSNSRLADLLNPVPLVYMPLWFNALCCGVATGGFYALVTRWSGCRTYLSLLIVLTLTAFTLRWDSLWMEFVTQYNYVWPTTMVLAAIALIVSDRNRKKWLVAMGIFLCPLAAGMHEAVGLPVALSLIVYFAINRSRLTLSRGILLFLFICGAIFTLLAPGNYRRFDDFVAPESLPDKIFGSAYYIVLLAIWTLWLIIDDRKRLKTLFRDWWLIFAVAAFSSVAFVIMAGYGGRPAWFGEVFALIALCRMASTYRVVLPGNVKKIVSVFLGSLLIFHFSGVAYWQHKLGQEFDDVLALFRGSADGVVFYDYTEDSRCPFYLFRKTRGVPDTDDVYYLYRVGQWYGDGKSITVLPTEYAKIDYSTFSGELRSDGTILTDRRIDEVEDRSFYKSYPRFVVKQGDTEYIEREFEKSGRRFYFYTPVDEDRGEK